MMMIRGCAWWIYRVALARQSEIQQDFKIEVGPGSSRCEGQLLPSWSQVLISTNFIHPKDDIMPNVFKQTSLYGKGLKIIWTLSTKLCSCSSKTFFCMIYDPYPEHHTHSPAPVTRGTIESKRKYFQTLCQPSLNFARNLMIGCANTRKQSWIRLYASVFVLLSAANCPWPFLTLDSDCQMFDINQILSSLAVPWYYHI